MELLRLGLSLGETAEVAMNSIIEFLESFGQWGSSLETFVPHQAGKA